MSKDYGAEWISTSKVPPQDQIRIWAVSAHVWGWSTGSWRASPRYVRPMIHNVHERVIAAPIDRVGSLIDSLASRNDRLWPEDTWPAMRLDGPIAVGASGGHGPVRYFVVSYEPGRQVEFEFTGPRGFNGRHSFSAVVSCENLTLLRHELKMRPSGAAKFTWPVFFKPLHDALIEESLDRAEHECGGSPEPCLRRSLWVRMLRATFSLKAGRGRSGR